MTLENPLLILNDPIRILVMQNLMLRDMTVDDIARKYSLAPATVYRAVKHLEKSGYVRGTGFKFNAGQQSNGVLKKHLSCGRRATKYRAIMISFELSFSPDTIKYDFYTDMGLQRQCDRVPDNIAIPTVRIR